MNDLLVLADLHFDTWIRNNPEPEWRMRKQPQLLAKRISEVMAEYKTNQLILLGDMINKYSSKSKVVSILQDFVESVTNLVPNLQIKYILGNHDRENNWDHSSESSLVSIAFRNYRNIEYVHDKTITINDTSIYFSNYCQKVIYPKQHVNVWLSHLTFGFTEIDNSKADLIVAGDIHKPWDEGNMHSVGTPWQLQADQPEEGFMGIITLDGVNSKFERISSESDEIKFVRIPKINKNLQVSTVINRIDVTNTIEEEVKKAGLEEVHALVDRNNAPSPINFNFTLKRLIIENYRSIDKMDLNFEDLGDIIYINGKNGSGKSSIFMAIQDVLMNRGSKIGKKRNKRTEDDVHLELFLDYEGSEYYIEKTGGSVKFSKDGNEIQLRQRDTQKELESHLPWIPYFNYFYHRANTNYWEVNDRRELMKVLFNFKALDYYANAGKTLKRQNEKDQESTAVEMEKSKSAINELNEMLKEKKSELEKIRPWDKGFLNDQLKLIQTVESDFRRCKNALDTDNSRLKSMQSTEVKTINKDSINKRITEIEKEMEEESERKSLVDRIQDQIDSAKKMINDMQKKVIICDKCGNKIGFSESDYEKYNKIIKENGVKLEELKSKEKNTVILLMEKNKLKSQLDEADKSTAILTEIEILKNQIKKNEEELKNIEIAESKILKDNNEQSLESYKNTLNSRLEITIRYESLKSDIASISDRIKLNDDKLGKSESKYLQLKDFEVKLNKYISLFDLKCSTSIPITHMNSFVSQMNTETLRFTAVDESGDLDIEVYYLVDGEWMEYEALSSGQRALVDIQLILHMSQGAGTLILDEPFSNMDAGKIEEALYFIQNAKVNKLLLTSHQDINNVYDSKISLELVNGITQQVNM